MRSDTRSEKGDEKWKRLHHPIIYFKNNNLTQVRAVLIHVFIEDVHLILISTTEM
jgi:hypothetical protein